MNISVRTFRHVHLTEQEEIQQTILVEGGVEIIARIYADFLSPPDYPDGGEGVDWEIVLYSYLDLKKAGFWDRISLESFFEIHGAKIGSHARQFLLRVRNHPDYV